MTLVDALGPVAVPHNPKHVPIIDKHVRGRVFEEVLSIAHLAGSGHISLINPQGVDLVQYAEQLDGYITECELQLVRVAWNYLSHEQRVELRQELGMTEGELPSYTTHWEKLKEHLSSCGLAKGVEEDLQLLEEEKGQAVAYCEQATALHREVCRRGSNTNRWAEQGSCDQHSTSVSQSSLTGDLINSTASLSLSHLSSLSQPWPVGKVYSLSASVLTLNNQMASLISCPLQKVKLRQYLKGQQVIACNTDDGFYYPGMMYTSLADS